MEPRDYILTRIEGEYAYLADENGDEVFIALALLPPGADVGSKIHVSQESLAAASWFYLENFSVSFRVVRNLSH